MMNIVTVIASIVLVKTVSYLIHSGNMLTTMAIISAISYILLTLSFGLAASIISKILFLMIRTPSMIFQTSLHVFYNAKSVFSTVFISISFS